jgi:hypothetical protein
MRISSLLRKARILRSTIISLTITEKMQRNWGVIFTAWRWWCDFHSIWSQVIPTLVNLSPSHSSPKLKTVHSKDLSVKKSTYLLLGMRIDQEYVFCLIRSCSQKVGARKIAKCQKWSLGGPLSKLCPSAPSCIQDGHHY